MTSAVENVVLLAENGDPIGVADKATVHDLDTRLHLAFSCHVFDEAGRILVTRRALAKLTWPGVWTNSFCGHPGPGEDIAEAVHRRATQELGIPAGALLALEPILPDFRYRAVDASGIVENEICPVYRAVVDAAALQPNPAEVAEYFWAEPHALLSAVEAAPFAFSPWLTLQLPGVMAALRAA